MALVEAAELEAVERRDDGDEDQDHIDAAHGASGVRLAWALARPGRSGKDVALRRRVAQESTRRAFNLNADH
jgi:hypothetical protein